MVESESLEEDGAASIADKDDQCGKGDTCERHLESTRMLPKSRFNSSHYTSNEPSMISTRYVQAS